MSSSRYERLRKLKQFCRNCKKLLLSMGWTTEEIERKFVGIAQHANGLLKHRIPDDRFVLDIVRHPKRGQRDEVMRVTREEALDRGYRWYCDNCLQVTRDSRPPVRCVRCFRRTKYISLKEEKPLTQ